ncbi:MAG: mycofactocin biosynthesis glycosyltransferase MftF [Thermodesulfobacteriota bacterium]
MDEEDGSLLYRLRPGIASKEAKGRLYLISSFPIKAISLHYAWKPAFERMSREGRLTFRDMAASIPRDDPSKVKRFLSDLVREGYLSQEGIDPSIDWPPVSVIIPVRNRPKEIAACLDSLERVSYPRDRLEVIVVNDASTDGTPRVVAEFPVRQISLDERRHAPGCRNMGAAAARGEVLAFIDSDCVADPLWLKELVPAFEQEEVGVVGGLVDSAMEDNGLDRYERVKSSLRVASWYKRSHERERSFYVPSCNLLVRRSLFLKIGGFREDLLVGEDVDFCWRMEDQGGWIDYLPVGKVYHRHRNRMKDFCIRRFEYGASEPALQQLHASRVKHLLLLPGAALFWVLILLSILGAGMVPLGLGCLWTLILGGTRYAGIRKRGIPIGFMPLLRSVLRSHGVFLYHCCAFVSRYYAVLALPVLPFSPLLACVVTCAHVLAGVTEFFIKRPRLSLLSFLFFFSAEQVSYQAGVWWGCFRRRFFSPVNPCLLFTQRKRARL